MADAFVGRTRELARLAERLDAIRERGSGIAVTLRGRRQVGKSRLIQEFCDRSGLPYLYLTAVKGASAVETIQRFLTEIDESSLRQASSAAGTVPAENWVGLFRAIDDLVSDEPVVIVLDEVPWLAEQDETFDGALQLAWDRYLGRKPVLLCLLGSDLHMMERLTSYDRPFYGRSDNMELRPLNPAETAEFTGLDGADAIEAQLLSGGLPGVVSRWPSGTPPLEYLRRKAAEPAEPVVGIPEAALFAEFPSPDTKRRVLEAIGAGDRTQGRIGATAGGMASGTLAPVLDQLGTVKRVIQREEPLSTRPGKPTLFHVADSNLRWYLTMGRDAQESARRGRGEQARRLIERRWSAWCGKAVEPLVRESLEMAAVEGRLPWTEVESVGGWWNRRFDPEIDLVGADRPPVARKIYFAGSIKWLQGPFDGRDLAALERSAPAIPGFEPEESGLVAVSRSGTSERIDRDRLSLVWGPDEILNAWRT
ncbi:ATP-binding protein [Glycomyces xiaoerkulensis]|uniref:ATP-binding protein n=1 Tax=Glycomyces xiaoerkulensis TaxID=2038139 RepID=UPI000C258EC0|nr:ATP-binding protein [Glycomyces xiaoerkulensis]